MLRIFHNTNYDFLNWWRTAAVLTIAFIVAGLLSFAIKGAPNYSIEFTGGTLMHFRFKAPPQAADIRAALDAGNIPNVEIQQFGTENEFVVRAQNSAAIAEQSKGAEDIARRIETALTTKYGPGSFDVVQTEAVGPRVGGELRRGAAIAMLLASFVTLIYLAIRFEWRFGVAAVLSTAHDVLITLAFIKIFHIEVSLTVVAAILTLLGYSGNDTIIIFDRVRENLKKDRRSSLHEILNRSINETLPRSLLTHATTLAATLALLIFAGEVLRPFSLVMTFGIFVATFSSMYVASPLLMYIENRWPRSVEDSHRAGVSHTVGKAEVPTESRTPAKPRKEGLQAR